MKRLWFVLLLALALAAAPGRAGAEQVFGLTTGNQLFTFDSATPGTISGLVSITGLRPGESIVGMDFRPANLGQLVGVGNLAGSGAVYTIDTTTGAATLINSGFTLLGTDFGVDFNPVPDALRITSNAGQNLRITAGGAGVVNVDGNLNPTPNSVVGSAYANNFAGATATTLYDIDSGSDSLLIQNPPNDGTLVPVGALGVNTGNQVGFDISGLTGVAYASLTPAGAPGSSFYTINLDTGAATLVGPIGSGSVQVRDISVQNTPEPGGMILAGLGALGLVGYAWRRRRAAA